VNSRKSRDLDEGLPLQNISRLGDLADQVDLTRNTPLMAKVGGSPITWTGETPILPLPPLLRPPQRPLPQFSWGNDGEPNMHLEPGPRSIIRLKPIRFMPVVRRSGRELRMTP
jgi:hypothetical protein